MTSRLLTVTCLGALLFTSRFSEATWPWKRPSVPWTKQAMAIQHLERSASGDQLVRFVVCPKYGNFRATAVPLMTVRAAFELKEDGVVLYQQRQSRFQRPLSVDELLRIFHWNLARSNAAEIAYQVEGHVRELGTSSSPRAIAEFYEAKIDPTGIARLGEVHFDRPSTRPRDAAPLAELLEHYRIHQMGEASLLIRLGPEHWRIVEHRGVHTGLQAKVLELLPKALAPYEGMSARAISLRRAAYDDVEAALVELAASKRTDFGPASIRYGRLPQVP